ncbi:MAG: response regulator [Planctomycetes bacterium]|nr:response regulator [Planctomycetota bacterium]
MSKKLLLVDDEEDVCLLLKHTLENKDKYQVEYELSGAAALRRLEGASFDLLLVDVMMPEMTGLEFCRLLTQRGLAEGTPIILLTALSDLAYSEEALLGYNGICLCMYKPFEMATLRENVRRALAPMLV